MTPVTVTQGDSAVVLGLPHTGMFIPTDIASKLNETGHARADADWHVDLLYEGLLEGATTVRANFHRYVIDANRDPAGASLYPGQNTTTLVPATDFDGRIIWNDPPSADDVPGRVASYHRPYHSALQSELERVKAYHGHVILYDCHSIRSRISHLFDGTLPDVNIGTFESRSCAPSIERTVQDICQSTPDFSSVLNGRFKGGWTTRHYGQPNQGVHAIQMELAQSTYLSSEAAPWGYDTEKADKLRGFLHTILCSLADWRPDT
ncbi:N-formylglutamate deformylase [Cognatishimia sp. MH4019]|uniref:N-formylglutamate deformylase n=1 Tax=Cognatishimia sp. MH4019 TaxID=2854030 RepID=UPI001CD1CD3C|nr:N-formylglutamate deformylase [Cognatishimia sp. MH4019]